MNQDEIIRRLSMGDGFGNIAPERIDTHISTIFLAGDDVYKLKHAVVTSYLDYSHLEDRRRFCQAEIDINRRTAPQIYLDVVPVRVTPEDALILGDGPGEPVEWLVHMHRFSQDALFDSIADERGLTRSEMIDLADAINDLHRDATPIVGSNACQHIAGVIDENETELGGAAAGAIDPQMAVLFSRQCRALYEIQKDRIDRRGESGNVRHCHGDLHLRNICLIDGKPTLFDAIEFSEDFSHIDILFDLAFLLMDLEHRSLRLPANILFNRYLYRTNDLDDLVLMPLYLALRAGIRAHTSAMAAEAEHDAKNKARLENQAARYLRLGLQFLNPRPVSLIAIGGFSGVGKSTAAAELAPFIGPAPGACILSSDLIRKRRMGVQPLERLGVDAYTRSIDDAVYDEMMDSAARVLSNGHSVILDATFQDPARRREAEMIGDRFGVFFEGFWLEAESKQLHERLEARSNDPSDATAAVLAGQLENDVGDLTWRQVAADQPIDAVARSMRDIISKNPEGP